MNWFLQNPLLGNPRVKKWVETLLAHKDSLEKAAGGRLGDVLGCGHWGCVIDMPRTPWALKLTVDPTEAHIWSKILALVEEERYGGDGFPRVKKLFELRPGIPYGRQGRTKRAYGIVREKVAPVFMEGWDRRLVVTPYTLKKLGIRKRYARIPTGYNKSRRADEPMQFTYHQLMELPGLDERTQYRVEEFHENVEAIQRYYSEARLYYKGDSYMSKSERIRRLEQVVYRMGGSVGGALGESLSMLLSHNVVLRDVHLGNIGWRVRGEIKGDYAHEGLVIFDPGHTPTAKRQLPEEQWRQFAALG